MADKPIIDEEKRKNLEKLLQGSDEDKALALSIVDQCDIEESFPELLIIVAAYPTFKHKLNTILIESKVFSSYVLHLLNGNESLIPIESDLNFIMDLWERHQKLYIMNTDLKFRKKLALAYTRNNFEPFKGPKGLNERSQFKNPKPQTTRGQVATKSMLKKNN